jgi:hypothetical protein
MRKIPRWIIHRDEMGVLLGHVQGGGEEGVGRAGEVDVQGGLNGGLEGVETHWSAWGSSQNQ